MANPRIKKSKNGWGWCRLEPWLLLTLSQLSVEIDHKWVGFDFGGDETCQPQSVEALHT